MSAILTILGRATRDPEMQQGKNSGTEYVSLDIAVSQRGQDGKEETIYYQCYFNKFLAERLAKAGVKKGTGLMIYGDLELHPFIYQKGKNLGYLNGGACCGLLLPVVARLAAAARAERHGCCEQRR